MAKLTEKDIQNLLGVGVALGSERDLLTLLSLILENGQHILKADAATLFLTETKRKVSSLRFKFVRNRNAKIKANEFALPIDGHSLVGYVAKQKKLINIDDVYKLDQSAPFVFNETFDQISGYRSRSLLSAPLLDHSGSLVGVVQFWNKRKNSGPTSFSSRDEQILKSLASQAAVAIENAQLYQDIQSLFKGFIKASVVAIEARDPTTFGHSERVARLTVAMAQEIGKISRGRFKDISFTLHELRQLEYAALLHDFGKIGVRENILLKANKLYEWEYQDVMQNLSLALKDKEIAILKQKMTLLQEGLDSGHEAFKKLDLELKSMRQSITQVIAFLATLNKPFVTRRPISHSINMLRDLSFTDLFAQSQPVITEDQFIRLHLSKGTLSEEERLQIEEHVTHSYLFLRQIPWTRTFARVPEIVYSHHEKLDGSGYPRGLLSTEIPLEARIMTVADIFDALVARDRPYKHALKAAKALDILKEERDENKLDPDLVDLFIHKKIYKLTEPKA